MILTILEIILLVILAILTLKQKNISKLDYILPLSMLIISLLVTSYYKYLLVDINNRYNQAEDFKQQMILEQDNNTNNIDTRIGDDL